MQNLSLPRNRKDLMLSYHLKDLIIYKISKTKTFEFILPSPSSFIVSQDSGRPFSLILFRCILLDQDTPSNYLFADYKNYFIKFFKKIQTILCQ